MEDYDKVGLFRGTQLASRWLARLRHERRRVGRGSTPEEFFEAVEILFDDDAAFWLDSSVRYRRMIDNREKATKEDVEEFETALRGEFPKNLQQSWMKRTCMRTSGASNRDLRNH
ncbi:hypothetical protein K3495_g10795 [Podosphaera aphanis]|nr:hypothetical protein K3495_g10795 [Podosphaera aphanis]